MTPITGATILGSVCLLSVSLAGIFMTDSTPTITTLVSLTTLFGIQLLQMAKAEKMATNQEVIKDKVDEVHQATSGIKQQLVVAETTAATTAAAAATAATNQSKGGERWQT